MRLVIALPVLGLLASAALAAAPGPPRLELRVTAFDTRPGAVAETDLDLELPDGSGPVSILVPTGYVVNLTRRAGSVVGAATVTAGGVRRSSELRAAAGTTWAATTLQVLVSADKLTFTPPPGASEVDLDLQGVLTNPASTLAVWRATTGGLEARSIVPIPQRLGLRAVSIRGRVTLRGRLLAGGHARPGVNVHLALAARDDLTRAREIGVATTRADGSFVLAYPTTARPLTALGYVNAYLASCTAPCVSETVAPPPAEVVSVETQGRVGPSRGSRTLWWRGTQTST